MLALFGCAPEIGDGVFSCEKTADCPPELSCKFGRCYHSLPSGCSPVCGDVDQNGERNTADVEAASGISGPVTSACATKALDLIGDGTIDDKDRHVLYWLTQATEVSETCARCANDCPGAPPGQGPCATCPWPCGDVNLSGQANAEDGRLIKSWLDGTLEAATLCACKLLAADFDGSGVVDEGDRDTANRLANGETITQADCAPFAPKQ